MAHSKKFEKYIEHVENKISDTDALAGLNKKDCWDIENETLSITNLVNTTGD